MIRVLLRRVGYQGLAALPGLVLLLGIAIPLHAQSRDVEMAGSLYGVPVPATYWQQVALEPSAFEFEHALLSRAPARGDVRLPVVLALFADSPEPVTITRDAVQRVLFTGPAERGTLTEAYDEMSRGALRVEGDVFGWVRSSLPTGEAVPPGGLPSAGHTGLGAYFAEALDSLDGTIDFSQYDNDGPDGIANSGDDDGFVDVMTFEYLEVGAHCGGPGVWPHRSTMTARTGAPYTTDDVGIDGSPIRVEDYLTQSAAGCDEEIQDASIMVHEFGHALGLPDWYHWIDPSAGPYGRRWILGCWALMAAGAWGCGEVTDNPPAFGPTHLIGYSKARLGWVDPIDPGELWEEEVAIGPIQTTGDLLKIPLDDEGDAFLFIEFRDTLGFDRDLPGRGVLMYVQNSRFPLRPNPDAPRYYFLSLIEQDGYDNLQRTASEGGNWGEATDLWNSGYLSYYTAPSFYGSYTPDPWSVLVNDISVDGDVARINLTTGRTPRLRGPFADVPVVPLRRFSEYFDIVGGWGAAGGYDFTVTGDTASVEIEQAGFGFFVRGAVAEGDSAQIDVVVSAPGGYSSEQATIRFVADGLWAPGSAVELFRNLLYSSNYPISSYFSELERQHLDQRGNMNGRYDLGDARKWLLENR